MENSVDNLEFKTEMSSYSSFYNTQLSLHRDKSKLKEESGENNESDIADKSTIKDSTETDVSNVRDIYNTGNKTSSDMNNNSNDNKENLLKETDDQFNETKQTLHNDIGKSVNEASEKTENKHDDNERENDVGSLNEKESSSMSNHHQHFTEQKLSSHDDMQQDDTGKPANESRLGDGSIDPKKSPIDNENHVTLSKTSVSTCEEDNIWTQMHDKDIGTENADVKEITKQDEGNEGEHTPGVGKNADDKLLLRQTDTPPEDISKAGVKVVESENVPLIDQLFGNEENKTRISSADEKVPLQKQGIDLDQMPDTEQENVNETTSKEEERLQDGKHGEEIVTSLREPYMHETTNDVIIQNSDRDKENKDRLSVSSEECTPTLEAEGSIVTKQADKSNKRNDEGKGDIRSAFDDMDKSNIQGEVVDAVTNVDKSRTKTTEQASESVSSENVDISQSNTSTYDNLFFTGRLPSLLSRNESPVPIPTKKTERSGAIAEETEQAVKTETFKLSRENDERVRESEKKMESLLTVDDRRYDVRGEGGGDNKSGERKTPTPSRKIRELIDEMKEQPNSDYLVSREKHISPRGSSNRNKGASSFQGTYKTDIFNDAINEVQEANEPVKSEINDDKSDSANMTVEDINMVTTKVLGTTYAEDRQSKFDNMPHMKQIEDYVQGNVKIEQTPSTTESTDRKTLDTAHVNTVKITPTEKEHKQSVDNRTTSENDFLPHRTKQSPQLYLQTQSKSKFIQSADQFDNETQRRSDQSGSHTMQQNSENPEHTQVQDSSYENDLKAIIASAKFAISTGTDTTESQTGFGTSDTSGFTLQGDNVSLVRKGTSTRTTSKGVWSTSSQSNNQETLASLICSNCLRIDSNIHSAGYCTDCQKYLCNTCITLHTVNNDTRFHEILPSYCKNELAINKYVPATGYCADCSMFLCMKCVVQHTGFRANRHHRIIQSSFVSKPSDKQAVAEEFLDEPQEKSGQMGSTESLHAKKEKKKKRKLLSDLDTSNPYSFPFSKVPASLYPGPNKKLSSSYTKNPKWVHSSIPNLPYLVPPKPIPDRVFHAAGHKRPLMVYTRPKTGLDAMAAKFKLLKSRYKIKDGPKTIRRREQALFTARPAKGRDNLSLPDVSSIKSHVSGRKSVKHIAEHDTSDGRRKIEFINEHCLSIPFPRGEKRTDILAMAILMNGKLAVLDKNNNNIKLFNKTFQCVSALQFQNRLIDICASNLCPTDIYAATPKHMYEISAQKGMEITRKMKVEIRRIEGMACWKYGLAIVTKKTNITWELRLLDYRGNLKSKLEIFNPFTLDIASSTLHHIASSRGGKYISLSDTKNSCIITVDVTTRVVVHETMLEEGKNPTYVTSDGEGNHNLYVSCDNKVFQISRKGKVIGALIDKAKENGEIGCIIYNTQNDRMYVKTGKDMISVYQIYF